MFKPERMKKKLAVFRGIVPDRGAASRLPPPQLRRPRSLRCKVLHGETGVQVFVGFKVYDDDNFQIFVQTGCDQSGYEETDHNADMYSRHGRLLSITEFTGEKIPIPAKALYRASVPKSVPDFVLEVEMLRYILGTPGSVGPKKGGNRLPQLNVIVYEGFYFYVLR